MAHRNIHKVLPSVKVNMGGIFLEQPLPHREVEMIDPFLLVHHWANTLPGNQHPRDVGVGPHPHRGFSPVTFIFKGAVHHRDSLGNSDIVSAGGTQWMNSGRGIVHSERPFKELAEEGGDFEIIQFWVNAPANKKMLPAHYQMLSQEKTPTLLSEDKKIKVGVVAGELPGFSGPIETHSPLLALRLDMEADGQIEIPIPEGYNAFVYQLDGEMKINKQTTTQAKDLTWFENTGDNIHLQSVQNTRCILLAGQPINEPVYSHGPFVLNSENQLLEATRDYQMGKMGVLIEEF